MLARTEHAVTGNWQLAHHTRKRCRARTLFSPFLPPLSDLLRAISSHVPTRLANTGLVIGCGRGVVGRQHVSMRLGGYDYYTPYYSSTTTYYLLLGPTVYGSEQDRRQYLGCGWIRRSETDSFI